MVTAGKKRRRFARPIGRRRYRKVYVVAVEGRKTEPQYFAILDQSSSVIQIKCLEGKDDTSPPQVLKRLTEYLRGEKLKTSDEAWLVVDKDHWTDDQLSQLSNWTTETENRSLAVSNPSFEYWLLLHFEDGTGIRSQRECKDRLRRHLPDYDKGVDSSRLSAEMIRLAVTRAKRRDNPPCVDWPTQLGQTTVYRLVEKVLKE